MVSVARSGAYLVIGGFATRAAGHNRRTMDVDLLVADDPDNQARVFGALFAGLEIAHRVVGKRRHGTAAADRRP
jgi:hypothetical protein